MIVDYRQIRSGANFPGLRNSRLHYLDNAATAQMPEVVLDAVRRFEVEARANVHEGLHARARAATEAYNRARTRVARFLNAGSEQEVVGGTANGLRSLTCSSCAPIGRCAATRTGSSSAAQTFRLSSRYAEQQQVGAALTGCCIGSASPRRTEMRQRALAPCSTSVPRIA